MLPFSLNILMSFSKLNLLFASSLKGNGDIVLADQMLN